MTDDKTNPSDWSIEYKNSNILFKHANSDVKINYDNFLSIFKIEKIEEIFKSILDVNVTKWSIVCKNETLFYKNNDGRITADTDDGYLTNKSLQHILKKLHNRFIILRKLYVINCLMLIKQNGL